MRADISHMHMLKSAIEQVLGVDAWYDLKECTSLKTWRSYVIKIIKGIKVGVEETVKISDDAWRVEVNENLDRGLEAAKTAKDMDELLSAFAATLIRQVFLQLGQVPTLNGVKRTGSSRENWQFDRRRSVQYVQSPAQREAAFWGTQQHALGVANQRKLHDRYVSSKSKLPYSRWCGEYGG